MNGRLQNYANGEQGEVEQLLSELSESIESIRAHLLGGMQNKRAAVMTKGEGLVSHLEAELSSLREKRALLETQATSQDHIGFLQVGHWGTILGRFAFYGVL